MSLAEIISTAIGVAGLASAYVFYRRSRRTRRIHYSTRGVNVLQDFIANVEGLSVTYKGQAVSTLSVTRLALWNAGSDTITSEDIAATDPLRIGADDGIAIRDIGVILTTSRGSAVSAAAEVNDGELFFDYLDPRDGAILQVIHTGTQDRHVHLAGSVRGAGQPRKVVPERNMLSFAGSALGFVAAFAIVTVFSDQITEWGDRLPAIASFIFFTAIFPLGMLSGALMMRPFYRRYPARMKEFGTLPLVSAASPEPRDS